LTLDIFMVTARGGGVSGAAMMAAHVFRLYDNYQEAYPSKEFMLARRNFIVDENGHGPRPNFQPEGPCPTPSCMRVTTT
jgi:hypothetical protein